MTLTSDDLAKMLFELKARLPSPPAFDGRVIFSAHCLKETDQRLFPASRHRSRRIHKKLVKRFGGEFEKVPTIFQVGRTFYAHPAMRAELNRIFERRTYP